MRPITHPNPNPNPNPYPNPSPSPNPNPNQVMRRIKLANAAPNVPLAVLDALTRTVLPAPNPTRHPNPDSTPPPNPKPDANTTPTYP